MTGEAGSRHAAIAMTAHQVDRRERLGAVLCEAGQSLQAAAADGHEAWFGGEIAAELGFQHAVGGAASDGAAGGGTGHVHCICVHTDVCACRAGNDTIPAAADAGGRRVHVCHRVGVANDAGEVGVDHGLHAALSAERVWRQRCARERRTFCDPRSVLLDAPS